MVSELRRRGEAAPSPRRVRPLPRQAVSSAAAAVGKAPTARWLGQKQGGTAKNFRPWLQGSQPGAFCVFATAAALRRRQDATSSVAGATASPQGEAEGKSGFRAGKAFLFAEQVGRSAAAAGR